MTSLRVEHSQGPVILMAAHFFVLHEDHEPAPPPLDSHAVVFDFRTADAPT